METFGERITRLRHAKIMSRRALAERIGVTHASIIRIERGDHKPRADSLHPMARALGVSIDYLMTGQEIPATAALHRAIRAQTPHATLLAMVDQQEKRG